jgi:hypothetical protein
VRLPHMTRCPYLYAYAYAASRLTDLTQRSANEFKLGLLAASANRAGGFSKPPPSTSRQPL